MRDDKDEAFARWKAAAEEVELLDAAKQVNAALKRIGHEWVGPCPSCGGNDRFSINPGKSKWNCRGHGGGSSVISMMMHIGELTYVEACEALTGEPPPNGQARPLSAEEKAEKERRREAAQAARRQREAEERERQEDTTAAAERIWKRCLPLKGTHSERYLLERLGIEPKGGWPDVLRHHPGLPYPPLDGEIDRNLVFPTLVCRVSDVSDEFTAIWRIFLHPTKPEKAPVPNAKLGLGPAGGGAVRIGGSGPVIGIAEGGESALGAWLYIGQKYPVWSALSTSGMAGLQTPLDVERVNIFPDGDKRFRKARGRSQERYEVAEPAGRVAAKALFDSVKPMGIIQPEPKVGQDYCDMWRKKLERVTYG